MWWETVIQTLLAVAAIDIVLAIIVGTIFYLSGRKYDMEESGNTTIVIDAPEEAIKDVHNLRLRLIKINNSEKGGRLFPDDLEVIIHLLGLLTFEYAKQLERSDA